MNTTYLNELNDAQRKAVMSTEGPLLVVAGAGAGKTRVIAYRILHLVNEGVPAHSICAITFTNKAAGEMKERVGAYAHDHGLTLSGTPTLSTFHALGVRILREFGEAISIPRSFIIFDRRDSRRAMKEAMKRSGIDTSAYKPDTLLGLLSRMKGDGIHPDAIAPDSPIEEVLANVGREYTTILRSDNALDFDDLLLLTHKLLVDHPDIQATLQKRYTHLHVDEYQDTNQIQYDLMKRLVGKRQNVCVVGDADQTIYTWRGARIKNILSFEKDFKNPTIIYLEENYRSTKNILAAANDVISQNKERYEKTSFTNNTDGELLELHMEENEHEEAARVVEIINQERVDGTSLEEIAVLYRANFQSRVIEQALVNEGIPYHLVGTRFFERKEVKDVLSYLRLLVNPESTIDLKRAINEPKRGIGKKTVEDLLGKGKQGLRASARKRVEQFENMMSELRDMFETDKVSEIIDAVIKKSGLADQYTNGSEDDAERLENIQELVNLGVALDEMDARKGITKLLEDAALTSDQDELKGEKHGIRLMTVHAAKGLEFDTVIIPGLEQGLFPLERDTMSREEAEEERRLFYVALTRARKRVFLISSFARTRFGSTQFNEPSSFIKEIDPSRFKEAPVDDEPQTVTNYLEIDW